MDVQWLLDLPQGLKRGDSSSRPNLVLRAGDLLTAAVLEVDRGRDALIAFGQFKAYARLPLPVVSGQTIQIQVQQAEDGPRLAMMPNGDSGKPVPGAPDSRGLPIHLFEPVTDRPHLSAHSYLLSPGESLDGRITGFQKDGLMLVDFGKFKAFARIDVPVREGQILPLTVAKTDQGITFSVDNRPLASLASQAASSALAPSVPTAVAGRGGEAAMAPSAPASPLPLPAMAPESNARWSPLSAASDPPTAPQMARLGDQIRRILEHPDLPKETSDATWTPPAKAALAHLQQMLRPLSMAGDATTLMAGIRNFVENSGVYFEKRVETAIRELQDPSRPMNPVELAQQPSIRELMVKDLKPNLLILNQLLESQPLDRLAGDRHVLETMKSVVQRTLAHIEQQQVGATEKPVDQDLFQTFSHLLMLADHGRDARLKVYYAKKGRRDNADKNPRVALLLEMDRLGTVRSDLWMVGKDLNITFYVQTEGTRAAIGAVQDEIKTVLSKSFNTVAVSVVVSERKIEQFDGEDLSQAPQHLLDLTI